MAMSKPTQLALFDTIAEARKERKSREQIFNGYEEFLKKFTEKPKTTDDCYTPQPIYDEVVKWVGEQIDLSGREIVRPFYPGGDYQRHAYPDNCIVIDNPPFSIYAQIIRWYLLMGIDFFLFAPALTQRVNDADVCYVVVGVEVIYENNASVSTSFTTNIFPEKRIWVNGELYDRLKAVNKKQTKSFQSYILPNNVFNIPLLLKISSHGGELVINCEDIQYMNGPLDTLRELGKSTFGGIFIISERAAAERAAAERAAAEDAIIVELSPRERKLYADIINKK